MLQYSKVYVFREVEFGGEIFFEYFGIASRCQQERGIYIISDYVLDYNEHFRLQNPIEELYLEEPSI